MYLEPTNMLALKNAKFSSSRKLHIYAYHISRQVNFSWYFHIYICSYIIVHVNVNVNSNMYIHTCVPKMRVQFLFLTNFIGNTFWVGSFHWVGMNHSREAYT